MLALALSLLLTDARPNLVFLMADDLACGGVGCYGNPHVRTPHIDALAADGVTFDRHYVTTAICMASRATVLTGLYEYRHGCNFHTHSLRDVDWSKSYPALLRHAGYRTAFAGKLGLTVSPTPGNPNKGRLPEADFDRWGGGPGQTDYATKKNASIAHYAADYPHSSRAYGAFGADFVRESAAAGGPFCLSVSFKAPHRPVEWDAIYDDRYVGASFPKPANFGRDAGAHLPPQSRGGRQFPRFLEWGYADRYDETMAGYFRLVAGIDDAVGMIRAAVAEAGVAGETVVIFTSDNGYLCGSHGLASKVLPYEESARVPLIVYDPSDPGGGRRVDALTASTDFAPTLLDYAGVADPVERDGVSLRPLIAGVADRPRRSVALIDTWNPAGARSLAVVRETDAGVRKAVRWPASPDGHPAAEEVYHLSDDPGEMRRLPVDAADRAAIDAVLEDWDRRGVPAYGSFREAFAGRR